MRLGFRRLGEDDLPLLHEWLQREHVKRWWSKHETYAEVAGDYLPAIRGSEPTELYVIELDDRAAGFVQTYLVADYPEYEALVAAGDGVAGVDLFLADEGQTGRGIGSRSSRSSYATSSLPLLRRMHASPIRTPTIVRRSGRSRRPGSQWYASSGIRTTRIASTC